MGYGSGTSHYDDATDNETGGRVKKTFSNGMLAHVWAQNSQTFGQSNNGNFYFLGPILHSYGSHFVVGVVMPDGFAFLNSSTYSISTTKHQGAAWEANGHTIRVGYFRIDSVSARGDFVAGCHSINWAECERVAASLGLDYLTGAAGALSLSRGAA